MGKIHEGSRVRISGDSADLWIADYNVRVDSLSTVVADPSRYARKLLVIIDSIDGDSNVETFVRRSRAIPVEVDDITTYTAYAYEDDGIAVADSAKYDDKEEAIAFVKARNWDEVVDDASGEIVWRR